MSESPSSTATSAEPASGATEVVEAATAEAAVAAVHASLGADAQIVDARRVLRGGIGGFFAKEVVQLHAACGSSPERSAVVAAPTRGAEAEPDAGPATPVIPPADRGASPLSGPWGEVVRSEAGRSAAADAASYDPSPVDRLLQRAGDAPEAVDFATFLQRRLAEEHGPVTAPDEAVARTAPSEAVRRPSRPRRSGPSSPAAASSPVSPSSPSSPVTPSSAVSPFAGAEPMVWSPQASDPDTIFVRGLPDVAAEVVEDPSEDQQVASVDTAEVPCEPAPSTDGGPPWSAEGLIQLGLPVELVRSLEVAAPADDLAWTTALAEALRPNCRPLPDGPAVLLGPNAHLLRELEDTPAEGSETWTASLRRGRCVHLVVGGEGWRKALADQPLAASWGRPEDLPDALRCAVELGLVLGFGPLGGRIRRARPLDVALSIRDLVDLR